MGTKVAELKMSIKEFFNEKVNSRNVENPNSDDGELAESLSQSNQHEEELIGDTFRSKVGQILENDNAKFALAATGVVTAIALALITRGKVKNKKMYTFVTE